MIAAGADSVALGEVIIIGGGCYGSFYTRQLEAARLRGKATYTRLLIVDRDPECQLQRELGSGPDRRLVVSGWDEFLDQYLGARANGEKSPGDNDVIVPSPLMPHLMYQWLVRRAGYRWPSRLIETRPVPDSPRTPYDTEAPDSTRYISFADWLCPTHCIEPALCPVIGAPRTWEIAEALEGLVHRLNRTDPTTGPVLFQCRHTVFGVGTFSVASVLAGDRRVAEVGAADSAANVLVGTISSCHGAVNLLHLGPQGTADGSIFGVGRH